MDGSAETLLELRRRVASHPYLTFEGSPGGPKGRASNLSIIFYLFLQKLIEIVGLLLADNWLKLFWFFVDNLF
jgi:hypothetical protein